MKKNLIVTVILLVVSSVLLFGATEPQVLGSDTITFKGYIDGGIYFAVTKLNESSVNLLSEDLQPGNPGVDIGMWTLRVDNPPVTETTFTITYSFQPLRSTIVTIEDEIEFLLLERSEEGDDTPVERISNSTTTVTIGAGSGLNNHTKVFSARLTPTGFTTAMRAAATDTYQSDILVSLSAE